MSALDSERGAQVVGVSDLAALLLAIGVMMLAFALAYLFRRRLMRCLGIRPRRRRRR